MIQLVRISEFRLSGLRFHPGRCLNLQAGALYLEQKGGQKWKRGKKNSSLVLPLTFTFEKKENLIAGLLCFHVCILVEDTLLSHCLSPPRSYMNR